MENDRYNFGKHYIVLDTKLENHINSKNNPHNVTKADVGLSELENRPLETTIMKDSENYVSGGAVYSAVEDLQEQIDEKISTLDVVHIHDYEEIEGQKVFNNVTTFNDSVTFHTSNDYEISNVRTDLLHNTFWYRYTDLENPEKSTQYDYYIPRFTLTEDEKEELQKPVLHAKFVVQRNVISGPDRSRKTNAETMLIDLESINPEKPGYSLKANKDGFIKEETRRGNTYTYEYNLPNKSGYFIVDEYAPGEDSHIIYNIRKVTYTELGELIEESKLIPGQFYRIIDYVTSTVKSNTKSAGHPFDIVVQALTENKLSENAQAIRTEGDSYFANSKLEAWKIKYCFNNDTYRFDWADNVKAFRVSDGNNSFIYVRNRNLEGIAWSYLIDSTDKTYEEITNWFNLDLEDTIITEKETVSPGDVLDMQGAPVTVIGEMKIEGKGVIYSLTDEFNNTAPYDFKNILFTMELNDKRYENHYTFNRHYENTNTNEDCSLFGDILNCVIEPTIYDNQPTLYKLNKIIVSDIYSNLLVEYNCDNIYLSGSSNFNNTRILNNCENLELDNVGNCLINSYCRDLKIYNSREIKIGFNCNNIYIQSDDEDIDIGNYSNHISIGNECYRVLIGSNSKEIDLGSCASYIIFEDNNDYITFNDGEENSYEHIKIESGVKKVNLKGPYAMKNITLHKGTYSNDGNIREVILTEAQVSENYETNIYPSGSKDIILD